MATIYWRPGGKHHQPGAHAYLNWRENGKQWRRSLGAIEPAAAAKVCAQKEAELTHGVRIIPRLPTVRTYLEWYADWYDDDHPTTGGKLRSEIKPFIAKFGHRAIDSIRPIEVEAWKGDRLKECAPETVGKELRRIIAAFRRGIALGELDTNPCANVSAPRGVRSVAVEWYSADDIRKLSKASGRRGALWEFAAYTGLRRGELVKVRKSDVVSYGDGKTQTKRLRVESIPDGKGKGRTKSGKWREIPLNARAVAALARLPDQVAFGVGPDTLTHWFAKDAEDAKVGGNLHRLRHTFCAHLAIAGVSLRRIQVLAGHSDYKVTERYAHLSPQGGDDAVAVLDFSPVKKKSTPKAH